MTGVQTCALPIYFLKACEADSRGRTGLENCPTPEADLMLKVLEVAMSVDAGAVAKLFDTPEKIKEAVFAARLEAIKQKSIKAWA